MAEEGPLILIVDDEEQFREIFSVQLKYAGFRVETAENGQIGLRKAETLRPGLILLDMNMPGMSGAETLVKLRENPATLDIPVLFLSSLGSNDPHAQSVNDSFAKQLGALGYLRKTDDLERIVQVVNERLHPAPPIPPAPPEAT